MRGSEEDLNRRIIAGVISRERTASDLGPRETARVADIARTLWRGDKPVGYAVREAIDVVKSDR